MRHAVFSLLFALLCLVGCREDDGENEFFVDRPPSEAQAFQSLQVSYKNRNGEHYAKLLADDFRFYLDAATRQRDVNLPVFWTRLEDSVRTGNLFSSPEVSDIRVDLQFGTPRPDSSDGHEGWVYIDVLDTFLEVDLDVHNLTLRVDGQQQRFYFRKGKTPADTESETWYIVEWHDYGLVAAPGLPGNLLSDEPPARESGPVAIETTTWSGIKARFPLDRKTGRTE